MLPSDLSRLEGPETPAVHGARTVYVRSRVDVDGDRYVRSLWLQAPGAGDRRLTAGPADSRPTWSPDGERVGFVRRVDDVDRIMVIRVDGGEAEQVAEFPLGVRELHWSPDGSQLAAVATTWHGEWDGLDEDERARLPRRITRIPYRADGRGWIHDRRNHVWLIDPSGEESPRCVTPGEHDERGVAWSSDGARLAFLSDRHERGALVPGIDAWELDLAGGQTVRAVAERGNWHQVGYRPDGALHLIGRPDPRWPAVLGLHRREEDGTLTDLTVGLDRSLVSVVGESPAMRWDGDSCIVGLEDAGRMGVVAVSPAGEVRPLVSGDRTVSWFDCYAGRLVFTASDPVRPPEMYEADAGERLLTTLGSGVPTVEPDHFRVSSDGTEIDVWVYLPDGEEPLPVLLVIHGGPAAQFGFGFFDEFQVYAGAGFAVVACNPRGSSGRGEGFVRAVVGDGWGRVDHADVLAALDAALERHPRLDRARQGVMGGSYGGFLTAWLLARETRFASAVVERGLLSWTSFAGTSDIAARFPADYTEAEYPEGWERWWERSPLATAHRISTPTLIIHAEDDLRCPVEQAEQLFMALHRNGTPVEMIRFPGEGHEMSRSGSPRHRIERFEAILDWHRRHLAGRSVELGRPPATGID